MVPVGRARIVLKPLSPSTYNLGADRIYENSRDGVINKWGQTHEISNIYISDGSQFTTGAVENPTLAIFALVIQQAGRLARKGLQGNTC